MNRTTLWRLICISVILIAVLTFTPIITPAGKTTPFVLGMPYTLWMGILQTLILLGLTIAGSRVHPSLFDQENPNTDA